MKDTRPINMLILTVFMIALTAFAVATTSMARPRAGVEIRPANKDGSLRDLDLDTLQDEIFHPAVLRVFQTLTTLSAQMCQVSPQTNPVQMVGGRFRMHSVKIHPWAVICSLQAA